MALPTAYAWQSLGKDVSAASGTVGEVNIAGYTGITLACSLTSLTGGTTPSVQFLLDYKMPDGSYVQVAQTAALTVTGPAFISIGPGMSNPHVSGVIVRVRWVTVGIPATAVASLFILGELEY